MVKLENKNKKLKETIDKQKNDWERNVKFSELISEVGLINFKKTYDELINIKDIGQLRYVKFELKIYLLVKIKQKSSINFIF